MAHRLFPGLDGIKELLGMVEDAQRAAEEEQARANTSAAGEAQQPQSDPSSQAAQQPAGAAATSVVPPPSQPANYTQAHPEMRHPIRSYDSCASACS